MTASSGQFSTEIAIAWCLFWEQATPADRQQVRSAISNGKVKPSESSSAEPLQTFQSLVERISALQEHSISRYPQSQEALAEIASSAGLPNGKIGLIYGGATKIKQYVFEEAQLQDIRGASALLDRINLIDTPAMFHGEQSARFPQCQNARDYCQSVRTWLDRQQENLSQALIPELIVYSTGGNILAFCPQSQVEAIANAIEKRYTQETLTAQSCVVGDCFLPLEVFLGLLQDPVENTLWLNQVKANRNNSAVQAYFDLVPNKKQNITDEAIEQQFRSRKNFNELVGKLANQFNQRRSGWDDEQPRPSRRYPPMFETHPYLVRDDGDRRLAVVQGNETQLPDEPRLSEPLARKRWTGQLAKREDASEWSWYPNNFAASQRAFSSEPDEQDNDADSIVSWVSRFEQFLQEEGSVPEYDPQGQIFDNQYRLRNVHTREARSLHEIGAASNGFVAYIYADGNNMGQYIRDEIATPEEYQRFSKDIFEATEQAVYHALAKHIRPFKYKPDARSSRDSKKEVWIHPFEIITIGGDDVLLVVPANKGLEVAHAIGVKFEEILHDKKRYPLKPDGNKPTNLAAIHRYSSSSATPSKCRLSTSSGVLITAIDTPIYYADKLVSQLLKSAKKRAKELKKSGYYGGTVDFLTLKAVTMISSNIQSFRDEGLTKRFSERSHDLQLYAAPYTLHELGGLIETVRALHRSKFPKSQLYQIRSLLEQGKQTAILNYRYFRVRLQDKAMQDLLETQFEKAWCEAHTNPGNLAPWMTMPPKSDTDPDTDQGEQSGKSKDKAPRTLYETIWREIVDLLPFVKAQSTEDEDRQMRSLSQEAGR